VAGPSVPSSPRVVSRSPKSSMLQQLPRLIAADAAAFFRNYTGYTPGLPTWFWQVARLFTFLLTLGLVALLVLNGPLGLKVFWGMAIPSVPFLLLVAPGLWRQVCPMAFLNQLPRLYGFSRNRELPEFWKLAAFPIAVGLFVVCVALRVPLLNQSAGVLAGGLLGVLGLAFLGGYVFKGRSGWCGTFCPLGPIQRTYGQAPLTVVPNGYCPTCVGCQKHCYDFNPRAAVFSDLYDDDPRHAWQRRFFMGLLPGLIGGYFLQGAQPDQGLALYWLTLAAACCASAGLYGVLVVFLPVSPYRIAVAFGAVALGLFYWFSASTILHSIGDVINWSHPDWVSPIEQAFSVVAATLLLGSGLRSHAHHRRVRAQAKQRAAETLARVIPIVPAAANAPVVCERSSGRQAVVEPGATLLDTLRAAQWPVKHSCHAGLCGSDAVAVCSGTEHLNAPGDQELATLRRLGLEGRARLACMVEVQGPVTIDLDPAALAVPPATASGQDAAREDQAARAGIARVVVIGNGVAGMTAIEALRRQSPSVDLTVVGEEPLPFYNRMAIGQIIGEGTPPDGLGLADEAWLSARRVRALQGVSAVRIDRVLREVELDNGARLPYDRLILATGAAAMTPDPDFLLRANAFVLRTAADAESIRRHVRVSAARYAVVIGGGVLGVEAALALAQLGLKVAVLERAPRLMAGQLDDEAAARLARYLEGLGIQAFCGVDSPRYLGERVLHAVALAKGERLHADVFVACLGIAPRAALADAAGLETGSRGIVVDQAQRTADPFIQAIGDVADVSGRPGPRGLWQVGVDQAEAAVAAMLDAFRSEEGEARAPAAQVHAPRVVLRLKCSGLDLLSFGPVAALADDEVWHAAAGASAYWRLVWREGVLVSGMFVGAPGVGRLFERACQATGMAATREALNALH